MLVDEVLCLHGNILHPYHLACQLCTVEGLTHRRNQRQDVFFLGDPGILSGTKLVVLFHNKYVPSKKQTKDLPTPVIFFCVETNSNVASIRFTTTKYIHLIFLIGG